MLPRVRSELEDVLNQILPKVIKPSGFLILVADHCQIEKSEGNPIVASGKQRNGGGVKPCLIPTKLLLLQFSTVQATPDCERVDTLAGRRTRRLSMSESRGVQRGHPRRIQRVGSEASGVQYLRE